MRFAGNVEAKKEGRHVYVERPSAIEVASAEKTTTREAGVTCEERRTDILIESHIVSCGNAFYILS